MAQRRSLSLPITLGVVLIVLTVALAVGWILLAAPGATSGSSRPLYLTLLSVGSVGFVAVLTGVSIYLGLSVKTINLTRRQSNFIDSVTHELKTPIASLKLYIQTLNRREVDESTRHEFYRSMLDDVQRLDELIDHVLDAARLDKSPGRGELEVVDLGAIIERCALSVRQRHNISPDAIHLDLKRCRVKGRSIDLDIVFRNLLDNAVKYSGSSPEVSVSIDFATPEEAIIQVIDNGPGIPAPHRRRIFRRFERLGVELERKKPGLGLGLYLVRTLVRRMRGSVQVLTPSDGQGTLFEVRLPAIVDHGDLDHSDTASRSESLESKDHLRSDAEGAVHATSHSSR